METGGTKNRVFLKWIRSLPADRRKDELQRIVSGGVLNGTSAKSALFKLQKQCFVKLTRLNVLRGAMECARSTTFAASSCPPSPSSLHQPCSSPSPPPSGSKPITAKCRPCPLSRKRPSGTDSSIDTKRRNDASSPKPPQLVATASNLATDGDSRTSLQPADNFSPPPTLSHPNADPVTSTPCPETAVPSTPCPETAVPSTPCPETAVPSTPCPETAVPSTPCPKTVVPSTPCPETVVPSTPCLETAVPSRPCLEAVVPSSANAVPSIHCQPPSLPQQVQSSEQPAQSRAESMKQRMSTSEQQTSRVHLTPRVISEALRDVAMSLCAVELEMAKLDQELLAFEKLPPSHKNSRRLNALVESCTLLMMKAGSIKSCIDRGVAAKLGGSFYPTLLAEVNKIPKLALYSNLRLMTMVNILLQLSEPTCDPKYIVNAFISNNYSEWRPEENTENSLTEPKLTTTSSSRLPVGSSQTPNAQTTSKPPSKAEAAGIVRSEVTPKPPTEMKKQSAMHNAGGPRQEQQSLKHIPTPQPKPMTQCLPQSNQGVPHQPQWILQSAVPQQTHMQTGGPHSRKVYANPNVHNQSHSRVKNNVPNQPQAMGPHISNPNQALVQPNVQHVPHHLQCQPPMRTGVPSQPQVSRQSAAPNHPEMTWQSAAPNQPQMTRHPAAPNQHQVMNPQMANSQVLYLRLPENMQPVQNPQVNTQLATQISSPSHVPRGFVPNASNGYIPATNGSVQQNRQSTFNPPVYPGNVPANDSTLLNYRRQQAQCGQGQQAQTMSLPVGGQPGPQPFQTQPLTHSHNDVGVGQRQNMQHNALSFTQDAQTLTLLLTQQYVANAALYNGSNLQLQSQGLTQEFMTRPGQDQAYQVVEQRSPVARTTSRDSGIATPEPAIYEDPSFRGGAATSALYKYHYQ